MIQTKNITYIKYFKVYFESAVKTMQNILTTLYCRFTCLQTSTSRITDHLVCKILLIRYCTVFSCITLVIPTIDCLILPFMVNALAGWLLIHILAIKKTKPAIKGDRSILVILTLFSLYLYIYLPLSSEQCGLVLSDENYCFAEKNT